MIGDIWESTEQPSNDSHALPHYRVDEDIINKDNNEQVQVLFDTLFIKSMKAAGAFVSPNDITTNS